MSNNKPTRLINLGNYEWCHWLVVASFIILGIFLAIFPSVISNKILLGPLIVGIVSIAIGVFCIIDHIIYKKKLKLWEEQNNNKK